MNQSLDSSLPRRIVHLHGGLRATDAKNGLIGIQLSAERRLAEFPAPDYARLYSTLSSMGLEPIGVEFVYGGTYIKSAPPDWQIASPTKGFAVLTEERAWQDVRTAANTDKEPILADFAARAVSYLRLLAIRAFQLSEAYNRMLRFTGVIEHNQLFDNVWKPHLEAAIHAFLADAASFRDLIAEGVWRLLLGGDASVTTLSSFLKRAKKNPNELAKNIVAAGEAGGWLKIFTELRNNVIHVAPVGKSQGLHLCQARDIFWGSARFIAMHYPLLTADGVIYSTDDSSLDFSDEIEERRRVDEFVRFCSSSIDALQYTWTTTDRLVDLLRTLRTVGSFRQEGVTITDADICGDIITP